MDDIFIIGAKKIRVQNPYKKEAKAFWRTPLGGLKPFRRNPFETYLKHDSGSAFTDGAGVG